MKATTHPRRKIYSLTIQLHYVKISAKSNKGQENQTKLEFVIDTSLKCLSKHGHPKTQTTQPRSQGLFPGLGVGPAPKPGKRPWERGCRPRRL